ncbi:MAG: hypothetical protein IJS65_04770 [Clostridia bacterium]|nr:hypothetical protein [Clostridia bacterium]
MTDGKENGKAASAPYDNGGADTEKRALTDDELTYTVAARILEKHRRAFEELAK